VLLEKAIILQGMKKPPTSYENSWFIAPCTELDTSPHPEPNESTPHPTSYLFVQSQFQSIEKLLSTGVYMYTTFFDIRVKKAFDTVPREHLREALKDGRKYTYYTAME